MKVKYSNIPTELRLMNREYKRLCRLGKPIPNAVRVKYNEYSTRVNRARMENDINELKAEVKELEAELNSLEFYVRSTGSRTKYKGIPKTLRSANNEYKYALRHGLEVSDDLRGLVNEYQRWQRNGGVNPDSKQ